MYLFSSLVHSLPIVLGIQPYPHTLGVVCGYGISATDICKHICDI